MARKPAAPYLDPLEQIWLAAAKRIGLVIERSEQVFAATDGAGELTIGEDAYLDPDDSIAQMTLHELCHSLIEGPESFDAPNWGLDNETDRDVPREHACLRVQAALAAPLGLRWFSIGHGARVDHASERVHVVSFWSAQREPSGDL